MLKCRNISIIYISMLNIFIDFYSYQNNIYILIWSGGNYTYYSDSQYWYYYRTTFMGNWYSYLWLSWNVGTVYLQCTWYTSVSQAVSHYYLLVTLFWYELRTCIIVAWRIPFYNYILHFLESRCSSFLPADSSAVDTSLSLFPSWLKLSVTYSI